MRRIRDIIYKKMDKISYALGLGIGHQLKNMGIENFSVEDFAQSIKDVMEDKATAMTSQEAQALLNTYFKERPSWRRMPRRRVWLRQRADCNTKS